MDYSSINAHLIQKNQPLIEVVLLVYQPESEEEEEESVSHVPEHDTEEKGEGDNGEYGRVDLLVRGDTVRIYYNLVLEIVNTCRFVRNNRFKDNFAEELVPTW